MTPRVHAIATLFGELTVAELGELHEAIETETTRRLVRSALAGVAHERLTRITAAKSAKETQ